MDTIQLRTFSQEERDKLAQKGYALPDGSFPIANVSDLKNAIQAAGRASNPEAAKRHIIKRAKALGASNLLPADWQSGVSAEAAHEMAVEAASYYHRPLPDGFSKCPTCSGTGMVAQPTPDAPALNQPSLDMPVMPYPQSNTNDGWK